MRWPKIQPIPPTDAQCDGIADLHGPHLPQLVMAGTRTRSPTRRSVIADPTSVIVPTASWPRTRPLVTAGKSPLRMCRSVPQMVVVSTRTTTSVGSTNCGSGTSVHDIEPGPWNTSAFMAPSLFPGEVEADVLGGVLRAGEEDRLVVEVHHAPVVRRADLLEDRSVEVLTEGFRELVVVEVEQSH